MYSKVQYLFLQSAVPHYFLAFSSNVVLKTTTNLKNPFDLSMHYCFGQNHTMVMIVSLPSLQML